MHNHSKAPWSVETKSITQFVHNYVRDAQGKCICVTTDLIDNNKAAIDARLIAAAPEMYQVLNDIENTLDSGTYRSVEELEAMLKQVSAVLSKVSHDLVVGES
jgi:hypothetical protein